MVLLLSLSGIIIIVSRGVFRGRRLQFATSIKADTGAAPARATNDVLRPNQKSVQAIRSRATLVQQWLGQAGMLLRQGVVRLKPAFGAAVGGAWHSVRRVRLPRRTRAVPTEPNIDALFASPAESATFTTRVVDTTPKVTAVLSRPVHGPKKKATPLQRAQTALQEKDYQHAEDILVDYIVHHTKDTKAYMLLGHVAMAKANWGECLEIFEQVMALKPGEPGAQAGLGIAAYNLGRYAKALPALQRAHEEDPTNRLVLADLLSIAQKMDNPALQRSINTKLAALESSEDLVSQRP